MTMNTAKDLFIHELGDMYDAEQRILQILPQLAKEAASSQARDAYTKHEAETRQQITNLDQCFQILGVQPERAACYAIAGIKQEHDNFLKETPSDDLLTMFDLGGAAKTESYEIASYKGLIEKATLLGQQQCAQLLQQNLQQEENMKQKVEMLSKQLSQQMVSSRS